MTLLKFNKLSKTKLINSSKFQTLEREVSMMNDLTNKVP